MPKRNLLKIIFKQMPKREQEKLKMRVLKDPILCQKVLVLMKQSQLAPWYLSRRNEKLYIIT